VIRRECNAPIPVDVILSPSEDLRVNSAKNLAPAPSLRSG
jgi:hypothetical protein